MTRLVFRNASVFDGCTAHLLENHAVVVEEGSIVELRAGDPSVAADVVIDVGGRTLMPGLIDLHTHPAMNHVLAAQAVTARTEIAALWAAQTMRRSLMAGFTTLRDAGGTDRIYLRALREGLIEGPRLYPAGRVIGATGGHADARDPDRRYPGDCASELEDRFANLADGPEAIRKAVREEIRAGVTQIKLFISGGVMSPSGRIDQVHYTEAEIRAAVETAEASFAYVMAHCHPDNAIRRAVECGVRTIEHCSFVGGETAALMVKRGTYAVPTLAVAKGLTQHAGSLGLRQINIDKLNGVFEPIMGSMEILRHAGVKVGFGTDVSGQLAQLQTSEFTLRAEVFSHHEILVSATSLAAEILREDGKLGVVAPGAHADLIVVDGDPLKDVRILDHSGAKVPLVMKAGHIHKNLLH